MSNSDSKSTIVSRRDLLGTIAAAALAGPIAAEAAQHVHDTAAASKKATGGVYKPKGLTAAEYKTLQVLTELIIPGAKEAAASEFIDTLCSGSTQMASIYSAGIAWMNNEIRRAHNTNFAAATADQQRALLDKIAWRKNASPELNPGIEFFDWARRMTVDAYFTSKVGIAAIGFKGNSSMQEYQVPVECIEHVKKQGGDLI